MKLNLEAKNDAEKKLLEYLENNVSEALAEKINNGTPYEKDGKNLINKKDLESFLSYANDEARKLAEKGKNYACIAIKSKVQTLTRQQKTKNTSYCVPAVRANPQSPPKTIKRQSLLPTKHM